MFNSLNKIKNLPHDTNIYCGHEYTKSNLNFCLKYDSKNTFLKDKEIDQYTSGYVFDDPWPKNIAQIKI